MDTRVPQPPSTVEAYQRRTTAHAPLVSRPVRYGHQHRQYVVPVPALRLCFFPARHARGREHDELELCNVRRDYSVGNSVLSGLGQEAVYTARVIGEERAV